MTDSYYNGPNYQIQNIRRSKDNTTNKLGINLIKIIKDHKLFILNGRLKPDYPAEFTCIEYNGKSTIDLTICSEYMLDCCLDFAITTQDTSDHFPTISKFLLSSENSSTKECNKQTRIYYKMSKYSNEIENRFNNIPEITNLNSDIIYNQIIQIMNDYIQIKNDKRIIQNKFKKPWFDKDCYKMKKMKQTSLKTFRENSNTLNFNNYRKLKQTYNNLIKAKKKNYLSKLETTLLKSSNDSKTFWTIIQKFRFKFDLCDNNSMISFEAWKKFYQRLPVTQIIPNLMFNYNSNNECLNSKFTLKELDEIINKTRINTSPGNDHIPTKFLKTLSNQARVKLLQLFNSMYKTTNYPDSWNSVILSMIHKKGDKTSPTNYRPIALLSTLRKCFTSLLATKFQYWTKITDLEAKFQYAFFKNKGTESAIFLLS
ncbi:uncharacterized protein [Centruroides vittatus]|uniref:uncharacterized protein n=1 Tax=Centruroides vittatus TaxID=120091 RepID=UPI00351029A1